VQVDFCGESDSNKAKVGIQEETGNFLWRERISHKNEFSWDPRVKTNHAEQECSQKMFFVLILGRLLWILYFHTVLRFY